MKVTPTALDGVVLIEPRIFRDDRGFFLEAYNTQAFAAAGLTMTFVQDNLSYSHRHVLRGLHYQISQAQGKLVGVVHGEIFDVAVDLRRSSPSFGKWIGERLSAENQKQLFIPVGFAHGFLALTEGAVVRYKTTDFYAPAAERTIVWDDRDLAIDWPLNGATPIVSAKDTQGSAFREAEEFA
jgi:dTDP-4-dehydrorhamnose 3,5-epimerase